MNNYIKYLKRTKGIKYEIVLWGGIGTFFLVNIFSISLWIAVIASITFGLLIGRSVFYFIEKAEFSKMPIENQAAVYMVILFLSLLYLASSIF